MSGLSPQPPYPWLGDSWARLCQLQAQGKLPHALLLSGASGIGLPSLAIAFAEYLLCLAPNNQRSCGKCKSCELLTTGNHPDIKQLVVEDKAASIKIDQVRAVKEFLGNTAQQGGRKVIVLFPAEAMNLNAANALLKNLEEPTPDTLFLLVSFQPAMLMATIRSRCAQIKSGLPTKQQALDWLSRNQVKDPETLLGLAQGKPLKVLEWVDEGVLGQVKEVEESLAALFEQQLSFVELAKKWSRFDPIWLIDQLVLFIYRALTLRHKNDDKLTSQLGAGGLQSLPDLRLHRLCDILFDSKRRLQSGANPNAALLLEELSLALESASQGR